MQYKVVTPNEVQIQAATQIHAQAFSALGHDLKVGKQILHALGCKLLVAEGDNAAEVIGYMQAFNRFPVCYLSWIAVHDSERNKGVASLLLREITGWAKEVGCSELRWSVILS